MKLIVKFSVVLDSPCGWVVVDRGTYQCDLREYFTLIWCRYIRCVPENGWKIQSVVSHHYFSKKSKKWIQNEEQIQKSQENYMAIARKNILCVSHTAAHRWKSHWCLDILVNILRTLHAFHRGQKVCRWNQNKTISLCACWIRIAVSRIQLRLENSIALMMTTKAMEKKEKKKNEAINRFPFSGHCFTSQWQQEWRRRRQLW